MTDRLTPPGPHGLYDPAYEHDACGVAFVARLGGEPDHGTVARALYALEHLEHRGAAGADPDTGDGAGILIQVPDRFLREVLDFDLPPLGRYGVGTVFLPQDPHRRAEAVRLVAEVVREEGQQLLGWRDVPVDTRYVGKTAARSMPAVRQLLVGLADDVEGELDVERKLYVLRRVIERRGGDQVAIPSLSARTMVLKGMLTAPQLPGFYPDLQDGRVASRVALVHSRFSTNTFPSWGLAHPYRFIAHNGEINAVMGNRNWMRAREATLASELFGDDLRKVLPVVAPGASDSATFDNVLELLVLGGRSLPHAMMMMIPEAYRGRDLPEELVGFYDFHGCLMEPWDGPAAVAFTDGHLVGATLDRNGLRPGRWAETADGYVVLASETGVLPTGPGEILRRGRLQPGKLFLVDLDAGRIVPDEEIKREVATRRPYGEWVKRCGVHLSDLPEKEPRTPRTEPLRKKQLAFGYTQEDLRMVLLPMAQTGAEPTGSMGNDTALAVLSDRQPQLCSYFKQLFAQVTNPPIDPIREAIVMSLHAGVGAEGNLLDESPEHAHQLTMDQPILRNAELERLRQVSSDVFVAATIDLTWPVEEGPAGMEGAVDRICRQASAHVEAGANILILSDRNLGPDRVAIPSLLATGAVHHHLVREGTRLKTGLVVESGDARDVHGVATLIGFGAAAVNPYVMLESLRALVADGTLDLSVEEAEANVVKAIGKGLMKILSKMGISTIQSYCGAQIFEAVGLEEALVERCFTGTASRIGGIGMEVLARETLDRHARAYPRKDEATDALPVGGNFQWRRDGEVHLWNPDTISMLQHAVRGGSGAAAEAYATFADEVNEQVTRRAALRGLMRFRTASRTPVPIEEVEPAAEIVKRFTTGAMSLGALSTESHETLAVAMNRLGGKSNTGEGGEDPRRFTDPAKDPNSSRSAIKQVASGRFGVTIHYLVNADAIQIKMAQGAKPGEGGQLPGHKVSREIAKLRHSTPGVGLISPPPHHDIYSIEDLKQLIYDLRCANPRATVSVKLVAEVGVGTVAAGVAKANADHVTISGHDGGTGASPQSSIHAAGVPWEIGLAETQQTLVQNDLRSRIVVEVDGQMKTGRDVVIGAMLGADEFGFSTAPLVAMGCIMMRVCHLNTCPVGIATQDPVLRERFAGKPEHVVNYLFLVAEEVRGYMARLGIYRFSDLIGRTDLLEMDAAIDHWKARGVDLSRVLAMPEGVTAETPLRRMRPPEPVLGDALDHQLIAAAEPALVEGRPVRLELAISNVNRTVGGMLSSRIAELHGPGGLPEGHVEVTFNGSAGQSFGAWLAPGVCFTLRGDANDYVGKGLSGGVLAVSPPDDAPYRAEENVLIGNTVLYGATAGRAFFRGLAGERFAVRNSGASAVVEGIGDHGCEYMTGGRVVVLGPTGLNFGAGMSGGVAYVHDVDGRFRDRCNTELIGFEELDDADRIELRELVAEHVERTGSTVGAAVLGDWDDVLPEFVKVMPHDYKRALAELAAEAEEGVPA